MARSPVAGPVPVTFVISHALSGGSERYLELLLDHLAPAWVHGVVSLQDGPFVPLIQPTQVFVATTDLRGAVFNPVYQIDVTQVSAK